MKARSYMHGFLLRYFFVRGINVQFTQVIFTICPTVGSASLLGI